MKQSLLVGSVATTVTERAWIERARSVTLVRLEDEVSFWNHLEDVRPEVWERLDGGPLPKGLMLTPGTTPRLHASARSKSRSALSAEELLKLLEDSEGSVPLPDHSCTIRMLLEPEVRVMWDGLVRRCREEISPDITEGDVLMLLIAEVWRTWDNAETRRQRRENPVLERDGWRCLVPGCRAMGTGRLQTHHVIYRSHGGTDDAWNEIAVCTAHHHHGIHTGIIRCSGRAPDDLTWEMGCAPGLDPFRVFHGQTRVGGSAMA